MHKEALKTRLDIKAQADVSYLRSCQLALLLWKIPEADEFAQKCMELRRKLYGAKRSSELSEIIWMRAEVLRAKGRLPDAKNLYDQSLANRRTTLADRHPLVAESLQSMGHMCLEMGILEV